MADNTDLQEQVNNPPHYNTTGLETIEIIKGAMKPEAFYGFLQGNILKYVCRYMFKGMAYKDLCKAKWYLDRLITEIGSTNADK